MFPFLISMDSHVQDWVEVVVKAEILHIPLLLEFISQTNGATMTSNEPQKERDISSMSKYFNT